MPVTVPDYEVFKTKTSVFRDRFHSDYGRKWKAVHLAYQAYVAVPTEVNGQTLFNCLHTYLEEHGKGTGNFDDHERNQNNFLKKIYDDLRVEYKNLLGDEKVSNIAAQETIERVEAPNTRLGVLYALSEIEIDGNFNLASTIMSAVSQTGSVTGNVLGADLSNLSTAKNAQYEAVMNFGGVGVDIDSKEITDFGEAGLSAAALLMQKANLGQTVKGRQVVKLEVKAPDSAFQYPMTAAAIESFGNSLSDSYNEMDYFDPSMAVAQGAMVITGGIVVGLTATAELARNTFAYVSSKAYQLYLTLKGKIKEYLDKLITRFSQDSQYAFQFSVSLAAGLLKVALKQVMGTAVPFIGNAITLAEKGVSAITNAVGAAVLAYSQKNVRMSPGHPELIAKYIIDSKWGQALSDACMAIQSAALVVVDATVPGVGSLVGAITAACQWIYGVVHQYFAVTNITKFLAEAKAKWNEQCDLDANVNPMFAHAPGASRYMDFLNDAGAFSAWFEKGCQASVLIPAIVIRSGMAGSWISWCRLISDSADRVSQKTFDEGIKFVDNLKDEALRVIRDSTIRITPVSGSQMSSHMVGMINGEKQVISRYQEVTL